MRHRIDDFIVGRNIERLALGIDYEFRRILSSRARRRMEKSRSARKDEPQIALFPAPKWLIYCGRHSEWRLGFRVSHLMFTSRALPGPFSESAESPRAFDADAPRSPDR